MTNTPTPKASHRDDSQLGKKISYSINGAVEITGIGRSYIYLAIKHGELATLKLGKRRIILHDDLVAWLNRQRVAA